MYLSLLDFNYSHIRAKLYQLLLLLIWNSQELKLWADIAGIFHRPDQDLVGWQDEELSVDDCQAILLERFKEDWFLTTSKQYLLDMTFSVQYRWNSLFVTIWARLRSSWEDWPYPESRNIQNDRTNYYDRYKFYQQPSCQRMTERSISSPQELYKIAREAEEARRRRQKSWNYSLIHLMLSMLF